MAQEYLKRTPTSTGNSYRFTISVWAKRNSDATSHRGHLFNAGPTEDFNDAFAWYLNSGHNLHMWNRVGGTYGYYQTPPAKYQDYSGWTHYLAYVDTTQEGEQEVKAAEYINGVLQSGSGNAVDPISINYESWINQRVAHYIGKRIGVLTGNWHGQMMDLYLVDGQALTPDVFGFYKDGNGYISAGSTQATDFRPGQWVPKTPRVIKAQIERNGGFGVNGVYIPLNDSSNFGADFHTTPNSIITLKGEDLPQPRNGAPTTTDAYVSQLRTDPYAANLVLAVPGISGGTSSGFGDYSADIKGSGSNKTMTTNASIGTTSSYYGSAMLFNGSDTELTTSTDLTDFTFGTGDFTLECWYSGVPEQRPLFELRGAASATNNLFVGANGEIYLGGSQQIAPATGITTGQFTHIAVERNGSLLTRYINGVATGINTNFTANVVSPNTEARFGMDQSETSFYNGYIQDLRVYKGVAKYKGGFDVPRPYTPVGIATWRAVPDTTANNFATLNFVDTNSQGTLSNGNLTFASNNNQTGRRATIGFPTTGEYYWETRITSSTGGWPNIGILKNGQRISSTYLTDGTTQIRPYGADSLRPYLIFDTTDVIAKVSDTALTGGDIIQCAWSSDGTDGKLWFGINDQWYGYNGSSVVTLTKAQVAAGNTAIRTVGVVTESWSPVMYIYRSEEHSLNFGQNPTFSGNITAGTFTDSNGKGLFKYEPPTDFLALCEDNLPTPAIKNPGEHFKTVLYRADGSDGRNITGIGFTPDLVWVKARNQAYNHGIFDSVRGSRRTLYANLTNVEAINGPYSFNADGFSLSSNWNNSSTDFVAWCWQAGAGTTTANTDGSINSVVSVNQDAGFSIVSYTGTGSNATIGHGLEKEPKMIIAKRRSGATENWPVYHAVEGPNRYAYLDLSNAYSSDSSVWQNVTPTSTVFSTGTSATTNASGAPYIAYCWAEIEGFSKFGSYVGNGDADGPFVYCGFKPAWVMVKNADDTGGRDWAIQDSSRASSNPCNKQLKPNQTEIENSGVADSTYQIDMLSNGFKVRNNTGIWNENGDTIIFAAFAESPFTTANAK